MEFFDVDQAVWTDSQRKEAEDVYKRQEFEQNGEVYISTEDGSAGTKGNVMDAIRENGLEADIFY